MSHEVPAETEVLVVGGGPGGYVAAIRAGQLGLDVTLVERDGIGGTCLNYGCIPSKALITATDRVHEITNSEEMGIYAEPYLDVAELMEWKDAVVNDLTGGVAALLQGNGVTLVEGRATFDSETSATIHRADGEVTTLEFEYAILATGSRPIKLPGFDFADDPILNSRQALSSDRVPGRLVVVGGGYIGMELSTVFSKLGADVTVVEMLDDLMPAFPDHLVEPVRKRAADFGIDCHFGLAADHWEETADGITVVAEDEGGQTAEFACDAVIVAVGREPVTDTVDLAAAGLEPDENGYLETDEQGQTDVSSIYAVGDVAGEPMLAHAATSEGIVAAAAIAGENHNLPSATPAVVFTDPEVATVGRSEAEAADDGYDPMVGRFPFTASGRAMTAGDTTGFVEVVADADTGRLLGGHVVGPEASELIGELTLAVEAGHDVADLATLIHPHPTLSEAIGESAEHALGHAIHTTNQR